jgi:glycosyltransferase involved in cell wall biosynthesis
VAASVAPGTPAARLLADAGAELTGARPRGDLDVVSWARFAGWLRRGRPDVLLATSWKRATAVLAAAALARVPRIVLRVGGPHPDRGRLGDRLRARAFGRWLDAAYTNSDELRVQIVQYAPGLDPNHVLVIPNGLESAHASPAPLRAELGLPDGVPLLLSVTGLEPRKGCDALLRAFAASSHTDARLVVAGAGRSQAALVRLATDLGITTRVHFLGHRSDVPELLRASDVFLLASRGDSTPNAVLEAMDAGLPVVMTATPGAAELLGARADRPAAGWVVPVDDAAALARALGEALRPAAAARAREAARRVREEHAPERTVDLVEALLAAAASPPDRPPRSP